jgi:hypothetical protein
MTLGPRMKDEAKAPATQADSRTSENAVNAKFAELPFRNCLENRNGSQIGFPKASKRGLRGVDRPPLGGKNLRSRSLRLFSKQFLHALR